MTAWRLLTVKSVRTKGIWLALFSAPVWIVAAGLSGALLTSQTHPLLASDTLAHLAATVTPNDKYYSAQWNMPAIRAPEAWSLTTGTPQVIIAVVDSGVEVRHPDLAAKILTGWDFVDGDESPAPATGSGNAFGTAIAGLAAAQTNNGQYIAGVAWGARILPIRVLNRKSTAPYDPVAANVETIAAGIRYAANQGAKVILMGFTLLNLSPADQQTLQAAIDDAYTAGALIVAAAGDHGVDETNPNPITYPAALNHVLTATGTTPNDTRWSDAEYGNYIHLAAPAAPITTIDSITTTVFFGASSTAFAAAHVAGAAALVLSMNPNLTNAEVENILKTTAVDIGTPGRDNYFGFGRLDAFAALQATPHDLQLTPASLQFTKFGFYASPAQLTITNTASSSATWQVQKDVAWLAVEGPTGGVPSTLTVSIVTAQVPPGACGTITGRITAISTLPFSTGDQVIPVNLQLLPCAGGTITYTPTPILLSTTTPTPTRTPTMIPTQTATPTASLTPTASPSPTASHTPTPLPADLAIALDAPSGVEAGGLLTYTLTYTNNGPGIARLVVITNTLPDGVDWTGIASPPGTPAGARTLHWDLADLAPGSNGQVTIIGQAQAGLVTGTSLIDRASATTAATESNPVNNTASHTATVVIADLEVGQHGPAIVQPNQTITYTLHYSNRGTAPARGVVLTDTLPVSVTFRTASIPATPDSQGRVRWDLGTLAPGEQGVIFLSVRADPMLPAGATLHNILEGSTLSREQSTSNNRSVFDTTRTLEQAADVYLVKTGTPRVQPAEIITYNLSFGNRGNLTAQNVRITDTLPLSVTYISASPNAVLNGRTLAWTIPPLEPGATDQLTLTMLAPIVSRMHLTNTATITTTSPEIGTDNNTGQAETDVQAGEPASIVLAPDEGALVVGPEHSVAITATVRDARGYLVDAVMVTFQIETGSGSLSQTQVPTQNGRAITRYLAGNKTGQVRITARAGNVTSARATLMTLLPGNPANVQLFANPTTTTAGTPVEIIAIILDAYANPVAEGTAVTLTTTLGQLAPSVATTSGGTARSTLNSTVAGSAQVRAIAGMASNSSPLSVSFTPGPAAQVRLSAKPAEIPIEDGVSRIEAQITDIYTNVITTPYDVSFETSQGSIAPGSARTVAGKATADLTAGRFAGIAAITATVQGLTPGYANVKLLPPDLAIGLDVIPKIPVAPGQWVTYTLVYANHGKAIARGIRVTVTIPDEVANFQPIAASPPITQTGADTWAVRDLGPDGDGGVITFTARLRPDFPWSGGRLVECGANITTVTDETNRSNNQAVARVQVVTVDLAVTTTFLDGDKRPGGVLRYRVTYNNLTPFMPAANAVITDILPAWTAFLEDTLDPASAPGLYRLTSPNEHVQVWRTDEPVGSGNFNFIFKVKIREDAPGGARLSNIVRIGSSTTDGDLSNNQQESEVITLDGMNLWIAHSPDPPLTLKPQQLITYTLNYQHEGNVPADNVVVTNILPPETEPAPGAYPPPTSQSGRTLVWLLRSLTGQPSGGTIRVVGRLQPGVKSGIILTNTASISSTTSETYLEDNISRSRILVIPDAPITPTIQVPSTVDLQTSVGITITVQDRYGNPAIDGTTVHLTTTLGVLDQLNPTTRNGQVKVNLFTGTHAGPATITARVGEYSAHKTIQIRPAPARFITIIAPEKIRILSSTWVTAEVQDGWGNPVADGTQVTFSTNLGLFGLDSTATVGTLNGIARLIFTADSLARTGWIRAEVNNRSTMVQVVTIAGPPNRITLQAANTTLRIDGPSTVITATVLDRYDNLVDDVPVSFFASRGTLSPNSTTTQSGVVIATYTPPTTIGGCLITAIVQTPDGPAEATIYLDIRPGPAAQIKVSANPPQLPVGRGLHSTLAITVTDAFDNLVDDAVIQLSTTLGRLATNALHAYNGLATTTLEPEQRAGLARVFLSVGPYTASVNVRFLAGEPDRITAGVHPASLSVDGTVTATLTLTVTDRFQNRVEDHTPVTLSAARVQVPQVTETTNGIARLPVRAGTTAGTGTITVTAGSAMTITHVTLRPGLPRKLEMSTDLPGLIIDRTSETLVRVAVRDQFQNLVLDGTPVTFTTSLGSINPSVSLTSGGVAKTQLKAGNVAGIAQVSASVGGDLQASLAVPILGGDPYFFALQVQPTRLVADNTSTASITATLSDVHGNQTRDGVDVVFSLANPNLGQLSPSQAVTQGGMVTTTLIAGSRIGDTQLIVASSGRAATQLVQFVPGPPYTMTIVPLPGAIQAGGTETSTISVRVSDRWHHPVEDGTRVTMTTSLGHFEQGTSIVVETRNGEASAQLYSSLEPGVAQIDLVSSHEVSAWVRVLFSSARFYLPLVLRIPGS